MVTVTDGWPKGERIGPAGARLYEALFRNGLTEADLQSLDAQEQQGSMEAEASTLNAQEQSALTEVDMNSLKAQEYFSLLDEKIESRVFYEHLTQPPEGVADSFVYEKREPEIAELRFQIREIAARADPYNKTRDYVIEQYLRRYVLMGVHDPMDLAEAIIISRNYGCTGRLHELVRSAIDQHLSPSAITELGLTDDPEQIIDIVDMGIQKDFDWGKDSRESFIFKLGSTILRKLKR